MFFSAMFQYAGTIFNSLENGKGIRDVIFFAGCDKHCKGCHNESYQPMDSGKEVRIDWAIEPVICHFQAGMIDGVTLSGGDPVCQSEELLYALEILKRHKINVWLYTGELMENIDKEILKYVDVVVDGPFVEELKTTEKRYVGSSNQRIFKKNEDGEFIESEY